jgi:hypothetical protein
MRKKLEKLKRGKALSKRLFAVLTGCVTAILLTFTVSANPPTKMSDIVTTDVAMGAWNEFIAVAGNLIPVMFLFVGFNIVMRLVKRIFGRTR